MIVSVLKKLKAAGVLGINQRNCDYTLAYNPRHLYPLVDDKLQTKKMAREAGLNVPELYGVVEIEHQIAGLGDYLKQFRDFVVKPAQGTGGDGIIVVTGRVGEHYRRTGGRLMPIEEMGHHVSSILSGLYSLGGHNDKAIIEARVRFDPVFEAISFQGVPDIRIIVFLGVPVMAMVRLPTSASDGKANLHQGAIGAGIDIASGITMTAVWHNDVIERHPDTNNPVTGIQVPHWRDLMDIAARCYELTGLGYFGVDLVLDNEQGPMILELNARPGLNIQIANRRGLLHRLKLIEQHAAGLKDVESRLDFARDKIAAMM
jgi:alpha-L-glutamate ligase-like protein